MPIDCCCRRRSAATKIVGLEGGRNAEICVAKKALFLWLAAISGWVVGVESGHKLPAVKRLVDGWLVVVGDQVNLICPESVFQSLKNINKRGTFIRTMI